MAEEQMTTNRMLHYEIKDPLELNLSYMPFIKNGGLFIPTQEIFALRELVTVELKLPGKKEALRVEGKVVWLIPNNALHHVLTGIGIEFVGDDVATVNRQIEAHLDTSIEVGGYAHGIQKFPINR